MSNLRHIYNFAEIVISRKTDKKINKMESDETVTSLIEEEDSDDPNFAKNFVTEEYDATEELLSKSNSVHRCKVCDDVFRFRKELMEHMKNSYECRTKKIYRCVECKQLFPNVGRFQLHLLMHSQENSDDTKVTKQTKSSKYVCELCGKDFVNQQLKKKHIEHHFDQRGSVLCPTCGKCITSKEMYQRHKTVHGVKTDKRKNKKNMQCKICNKFFTGPNRLKKHFGTHIQ